MAVSRQSRQFRLFENLWFIVVDFVLRFQGPWHEVQAPRNSLVIHFEAVEEVRQLSGVIGGLPVKGVGGKEVHCILPRLKFVFKFSTHRLPPQFHSQ